MQEVICDPQAENLCTSTWSDEPRMWLHYRLFWRLKLGAAAGGRYFSVRAADPGCAERRQEWHLPRAVLAAPAWCIQAQAGRFQHLPRLGLSPCHIGMPRAPGAMAGIPKALEEAWKEGVGDGRVYYSKKEQFIDF